MEGGTSLLRCTSIISSSSTSFNKKPQFLELRHLQSPVIYSYSSGLNRKFASLLPKLSSTRNSSLLLPRGSLLTPVLEVAEEVVLNSSDSVSPAKDMLPKVDKTGRFCSPRAARELALIVAYAACLEGSDPVRLFEKRMNMRREPSYEFDQASLLKYNNMSFGGPPVTVETQEEADKLFQEDAMESAVGNENRFNYVWQFFSPFFASIKNADHIQNIIFLRSYLSLYLHFLCSAEAEVLSAPRAGNL